MHVVWIIRRILRKHRQWNRVARPCGSSVLRMVGGCCAAPREQAPSPQGGAFALVSSRLLSHASWPVAPGSGLKAWFGVGLLTARSLYLPTVVRALPELNRGFPVPQPRPVGLAKGPFLRVQAGRACPLHFSAACASRLHAKARMP